MRFSMPFQSKEESREELCRLALAPGVNRRELCRQHKVRPRILYKWLDRFQREGVDGLSDRSRRPHCSPDRTEAEMEAAVLAVRLENPTWGGRKIAASLRRQGLSPPSASTITEILKRHGQPMVAAGQKAWKRFEHAEPNALWQMDFKGHVAFGQGRLHPLTVVDDHSRYAVILHATDNEQHQTVRNAVQAAFERYGLPEIILTDNGSPWGTTTEQTLTKFGVWLIEHGVAPWHSPPMHPQSHGKNERFNRTLNLKVEPFTYGADDVVRSVDAAANISFQNRRWKASKALVGKHVAVRPTDHDGVFDIVFRHVTIRSINFHKTS